MEAHSLPRILCVDDEPLVLEALVRTLRRDYEVTTATGGGAGLECLKSQGPFAVIVSDLRMPGIDGATFLRRARQYAPDSTRVLLTGQADLDAASLGVNEGSIFRFLTKPCSQVALASALQASVDQHRLVLAERELLEKTLHGSVKALIDILALASPLAFGRALRAKKLTTALMDRLGIADRWRIEVAAMLSQAGAITLGAETLERVYNGEPLLDEEVAAVDGLPAVSAQLFSDIPRLQPIIDIVTYQGKRFDGGGLPVDNLRGRTIPWGARALKIVLDFDILESQGFSRAVALEAMRGRRGWYDPEIFEAFIDIQGMLENDVKVLDIPLRAVRPGMVFVEDVRTRTGRLLIARGQEASDSLVERIRNLPRDLTVVEPLRIVARREPVGSRPD